MIINDLSNFLSAVNGTVPREWTVTSVDDETLTLTNQSHTLQLPSADVRAQLNFLASVGSLASDLSAAINAHQRAEDAKDLEAARAALTATYTDAGADVFGLVDTGNVWLAPGQPRNVTIVPRSTDVRYQSVKDVTGLEVRVNDTAIGAVVLNEDGQWRIEPRHRSGALGPAAEAVRPFKLSKSPWHDIVVPTIDGPAEGIAFLADVADDVTDWVSSVDELLARGEQVLAERAAEATEWRRLSKPAGRIPTKALKKWMADTSHIEYSSDGLALSGWRVVSKMVSGRTRPEHLNGDRRWSRAKSVVGVAEVLYVARLEHEPVRRAAGESSLGFYSHDLDKLRQALPDCVVRAPEGNKVIFVSTNDPAHVRDLEAAMVEWVLLNT